MVRARDKFKIPYDSGKLNFYCVDQGYVDELKRIEPKIPNVQYEIHNKFMCGVLFEINGLEYFAPVSSFKKAQKTNFLIKNKRGQVVGCIRFSFMFPIADSKRTVKEFASEGEARRFLLLEELDYCNRQAHRIRSKARHVYESVASGEDPRMAAVCCDFKRLEAYVREHYEL